MPRNHHHPRQIPLATLRDHLYAMGPSTIAEAARATGLRPAQVSALMNQWGLRAAPPPTVPHAGRCTLCRVAVEVADLCRRCHISLAGEDGDGGGAAVAAGRLSLDRRPGADCAPGPLVAPEARRQVPLR